MFGFRLKTWVLGGGKSKRLAENSTRRLEKSARRLDFPASASPFQASSFRFQRPNSGAHYGISYPQIHYFFIR